MAINDAGELQDTLPNRRALAAIVGALAKRLDAVGVVPLDDLAASACSGLSPADQNVAMEFIDRWRRVEEA